MKEKSSTSTMNYKNAVKYERKSAPVEKKTGIDIKKLKKGWVLLTKQGIFDTLTEEERKKIENEEFIKRANCGMKEIVDRYLLRLKTELVLEGYNEEEIENIIENITSYEDYEIEEEFLDEEDELISDEEDYM